MEGLSIHSIGKILYEKQTHFLLFKELKSLPKLENATINLDYFLLSKDNYRDHAESIQQIAVLMFEEPIDIEKRIINGSECITGLIDKNVAGYIWLHFEEYKIKGIKNTLKLDGDKAYIGPSFVVPQFRGKRIHDALLSRSFCRAYEKGCSHVYGSVRTENRTSIKGVSRIGYKPTEIHHRIRIGPFVFFPISKKGDLKYYSDKYYNTSRTARSDKSEYQFFEIAATNLYKYIMKNGWEGYDPYDGLNSKFTSEFSKNSKWLRILISQSIKNFPINIRGFLGIKKGMNLKGIGLLISAFLKLYKLTNDEKFLNNAQFCLELLKEKSLKKSYSDYCWAANYFNLQFSDTLGTPEIPSIICTVTCASGFLEYYEISGSEESLKIAQSSAKFITDNLFINKEEKSFFKYNPTDNSNIIVYNASTHGVMFLSHINKYIKNNENLGISKKVMDYIISKQKSNGEWYYSETNGIERKQIDFHQGFILDALNDFIKYTSPNDKKYMNALLKGAEFYRKNQFLPDGRCKWRYPRLWPVDIHNQAQGIITFSKLSDIKPEYLEFAKTIAKWTIDNMQDKTGYFYYQKWPFFTNRIPYMRWGQAWMMLALSTLLKEMDYGKQN